MKSPVEFEIDGLTFKVAPLKVKAAMRGWSILSGALLSALNGLDAPSTETLANVLSGLDRLPEMFDLFSDVAQVKLPGVSGFTRLREFEDDVFARRSDRILAFLVECVASEFGPLLDDAGKSVILKSVGNRFGFLLASIGQSTESQRAADTETP